MYVCHVTELTIGAPLYVDDILGIGDCKTVEKVIRNTRRLEEDKKFREKKIEIYGNKKWKGKIEEIKESVKDGIIERIDEYKYLGWWFSEANSYTKLRVKLVIGKRNKNNGRQNTSWKT